MNIDNTKNEAWRQLPLPTKKETWENVGIETTTYPIKEKTWKSFGIKMMIVYPT
jgi:hypothetical protein